MSKSAYLATLAKGLFPGKIKDAYELMRQCKVCPRVCGVDRSAGETGFCQMGAKAVVASASPHYGEERPLVGTGGSGTIFLTSCNLKCVFCQNYEISHLNEGKELEIPEFGNLMLGLQRMGCHNVNLVTPSHFVPQIIDAVHWAAGAGLTVPLVYNSGGYDSLEALKLLDGIVDIYMPDLKFMDSRVSDTLMGAPDYPEVATAAIKEMHRQVGDLQIDEQGLAVRGLLVRHLVMPNDLSSTREAMRFLANEISKQTYVNVMNQYRPCGKAVNHPQIDRSVTSAEYDEAVIAAQEEGITRLDERVAYRLRFV
jgi:putative pyruvate formate lyase activating enzyme